MTEAELRLSIIALFQVALGISDSTCEMWPNVAHKGGPRCPEKEESLSKQRRDITRDLGPFPLGANLIRSQMLYPVELQTQISKTLKPKFQIPRSIALDLGMWNSGVSKPGGRRDSNPQQPEPQSGALPLSYGHRRGNTELKV